MSFYVGYNVIYAGSCYVSGVLRTVSQNRCWHRYSLAVIPALALMWPGNSILKFAIAFGFSGVTWACGRRWNHRRRRRFFQRLYVGLASGFGDGERAGGFLFQCRRRTALDRRTDLAMLFVIVVSLAARGDLYESARPLITGGEQVEGAERMARECDA